MRTYSTRQIFGFASLFLLGLALTFSSYINRPPHLLTQAETSSITSASIEPETGSLSGAVTMRDDSTASGGKYVEFGTVTIPTSAPAPSSTETQTGLKDVTFQATNEDFLNPERGFYDDISISGGSDYSSIRQTNRTLAHAYIRLDSYRTTAIPASVLTDLDNGFAKLRQAKVKTIVRITYNFDTNSPDASESIINQHLSQLKPIFAKNQDVIYYIQAGFIGAWGEWHTSTNFSTGTDGNGGDFTTLSRIYKSILDSIPPTRMSALRYPAHQKGIFNNSEITSATAFDGSYLSRTGFHNDCFLADSIDEGTYNVTGMSTQAVKDYFARQTLYVPMTGETCAAPARVSCTTALSELEAMHWSALNEDFDPAAIDILKTQGCYPDIHKRLGYRFALQKVTVPSHIVPGGTMSFYMEIKNEGYAPLYNERPVYLVFENISSGVKTMQRVTAADPRRWLPVATQVINVVNTSVPVPSTLTTGTYRLYLWLPDAEATIQNTPEYAVHMANANMWQPTTGYNFLTDTIDVSP